MQDQFRFLKRGEHDILHDLELDHALRKRIKHENQIVVVRCVVFSLEKMPVCSKQQLGLLCRSFCLILAR